MWKILKCVLPPTNIIHHLQKLTQTSSIIILSLLVNDLQTDINMLKLPDVEVNSELPDTEKELLKCLQDLNWTC